MPESPDHSKENTSVNRESPGNFPQTRWTLVSAAQAPDSPEAIQALSELCKIYWFPLYSYARRRGFEREDAEDITQEFFRHIISNEALRTVTPNRGKLRSFLLVSMKHFLFDHYRKQSSQKRGGNVYHVSIDHEEAERRYLVEANNGLSPELEYDRAWARQLLAQVLRRLAEAYKTAGKGKLFEALQDHLTPGGDQRPYAEVAEAIGVSEPTVRFTAFKLRGAYREMLRDAIAETVTCREEVDEELAHLRAVFAS